MYRIENRVSLGLNWKIQSRESRTAFAGFDSSLLLILFVGISGVRWELCCRFAQFKWAHNVNRWILWSHLYLVASERTCRCSHFLLLFDFYYLVNSLLCANYAKCSNRWSIRVFFSLRFCLFTVRSHTTFAATRVDLDPRKKFTMAGTVACAHTAHDVYHIFFFFSFALLIGAKTSIIALVINFMAEMKWANEKKNRHRC